MYELRAENSKLGSGLLSYLSLWCSHGFIPLLTVYYLKIKNKIKFVCAIGAGIFMFLYDMQKITLIMPFLIWITYDYLNKHENNFKKKLFPFLSYLLIVISFILYFNLNNPIIFGISSIFFLRTLCISAYLNQLYLEFFIINGNPMTLYSHINFVNMITHYYPYKDSLGVVVANGIQNANANFLITDGLAAAGIVGIILISFIFIIFKSILNSLGLIYKLKYLIPIMLFSITALLNTSLFTSIISGGFLIIYLSLIYFNFKP
ncbi:MAG: hypothetical protein LIO65_06755, partial [Odoribacter sp.]|nr:hypothetical protein [Odoribacter sp.]